jgi:hypothetical protein
LRDSWIHKRRIFALMRFSKKTILFLILFLPGILVFAQHPKSKKSSYTRERYNANAARVRGSKAKIVCPIFVNSKFPYHGLGFKLGDPFAITYKFYPNKKLGIAIDAGKASSGLYNRYYISKFDDYIGDADVTYLSHKAKWDIVGEIKLLYHVDASKISPGLQAYAGVGWEFKNVQLQYSFTYDTSPPSGGTVRNEIDRLYRDRFTQGPQVVVGIEYSYFQIPISAFMEVECFQDVAADPGWRKFEGGVGLRYIF